MAGTFYQMPMQIVFAVKGKYPSAVLKQHKEEIEKYITAIINDKGCKLLAIYCNPDHIHILLGAKPSIAISTLVREIKSSSSNFIHKKFDQNNHFSWQNGYAVFCYSKSQIPFVVKYIMNQHEHHRKRSFREEYLDFLNKAEIEYDERHVFD